MGFNGGQALVAIFTMTVVGLALKQLTKSKRRRDSESTSRSDDASAEENEAFDSSGEEHKAPGDFQANAEGVSERSHSVGISVGYEVFLSFRGPDARLTIADCLYNDMIRAGIRAFKDDEELRFGEEIGGGLLQAINESRIYIPIFSKDYASSKWCLRELARIVELSRGNDEKVILPIFYDVDADDVKLKTKLYQEALRKHKSESGKDLAEKWKEALREVARIRGRNLKDHGSGNLMTLES